MAASPIREFALKALLWLPLAFVVWIYAAPLWVLPALLAAKAVLLGHWGQLFESVHLGGEVLDGAGRVVRRAGYLVTLGTRVMVQVPGGGGAAGVGVLEPTLNPMVYAYSLPLFAGLSMATPMSSGRRALQFLLALVVIWATQAFGIVAEGLKTLAFDSGAEGARAIAAAGIRPEAVALAYQFAVLILPALTPAALWIGLNRPFIQSLVERQGTRSSAAGPMHEG
jgi:hypothetical protein